MASLPLVSICVPTFNGQRYLEQCLESAMRQSFLDIEVIVVDDASTDATVEIARKFAANDRRVRVFENANNLGLVGNWNRAIGHASGQWIKLLFQDDVLAPTCVERLLGKAAESGSMFVSCLRQFLFEDGVLAQQQAFYLRQVKIVDDACRYGFLSSLKICAYALEFPGINFVGEPTVTLIHRDVFEFVGLFNPILAQRCDTEFWVRAGLRTGIHVVRLPLATFRVHSASTSATNYAKRFFSDEYLDLAIILHEYLFCPSFSQILDYARQQGNLEALESEFWSLCYEARQIAAVKDAPDGAALRREWARVIAAYPRIGHVGLPQRALRRIRRTASHALSRFIS